MMLYTLLRWRAGRVSLTWFMQGCGAGLTSTRMNSSMSSSASMLSTWNMTTCVLTHTITRGWCLQALVGQLYTAHFILQQNKKITFSCCSELVTVPIYVWCLKISLNVLSFWQLVSAFKILVSSFTLRNDLQDTAKLYLLVYWAVVLRIENFLKNV